MDSKPEFVIGLAGPAGTDLTGLARTIAEELSPFEYRCPQIRVSQLIQEFCDEELRSAISTAKHGRKVALLMGAGDVLRKQAGRGDALVPLVVTSIRKARNSILKEDGVTIEAENPVPADRVCYIINSLKHPDEVQELRRIYGENFVMISGFSSESERISELCELIAKSHTSTQNDKFRAEAERLIQLDAKRPGEKLGQSLRDTFPAADFFVRVSGNYDHEIERFLDLLFGSPYITPRIDEFHMFEAKSKAYRSADLSRQVGAVIVDRHNSIVSSGCNEVPIAGGGSYWPDEDKRFDNRDHAKHRDYNAVKKYEIIEEFISYMGEAGIVTFNEGKNPTDVVEDLLFGGSSSGFKDLRVSNLIEFGRVVHAEMNAITEAARRGLSVGGATLYCTTFPCHMCARHVIAAGIMKVVYVEPYPKSMTAELYEESITLDPAGDVGPANETNTHNRVAFHPFEGVAPSLYPELYRAGTRKNPRGYTVDWSKEAARPKIIRTGAAHLSLEAPLFSELEKLSDVGLKDITVHMGSELNVDHESRDP